MGAFGVRCGRPGRSIAPLAPDAQTVRGRPAGRARLDPRSPGPRSGTWSARRDHLRALTCTPAEIVGRRRAPRARMFRTKDSGISRRGCAVSGAARENSAAHHLRQLPSPWAALPAACFPGAQYGGVVSARATAGGSRRVGGNVSASGSGLLPLQLPICLPAGPHPPPRPV